MNDKRLTRRSFWRSFILFASIIVFIFPTSFVTEPPVSASAAIQPITLNAGMTGAEVVSVLPRAETLYFNGLQWGSVICWNPYASGCNNQLAIAQQDNARVTVFETPYIFNMLTGEQFPLLADGPYTWNLARTEITFELKAAAKWKDGTPVTAADVAYTWASHIKYDTEIGISYKDFIDTIEAVDPTTVLVKAKLDMDDKAINPLMVENYLNTSYVIQKAWTQILEARTDEDPVAFKSDTAEDVVWSGPYHKFSTNDTKVVLIRDDNYWGQDASMWGKLPSPKYLAHVIYADNAAGQAAFYGR